MTPTGPRRIHPAGQLDLDIAVPPSKSYTNRALIAAALADGTSTLTGTSRSDDSRIMIEALRNFGITITGTDGDLIVGGRNGLITTPSQEIGVGNAGTAMRFLTTLAALAPGTTVLNGDEQMRTRPIGKLVEALRSTGVRCHSAGGFPPVTIEGGTFHGGPVVITGETSSQFVSSILLSAPYARTPLTLSVRGRMRSLPYIDMTLHVMRSFGADVTVLDNQAYRVSTGERYIPQAYGIEGDASAATYFLAAAALTKGRVRITNLTRESLQGDIRFATILAEMGCRLSGDNGYIELRGGDLRGIEIDMNDLPDCVPTLAVVAAFADGPTTISHIEHLRLKETDRISALTAELTRLGARVDTPDGGMQITPRPLKGCAIETYNDHRIAMSFAIAGLVVPGVSIQNPECVSKSFPDFWKTFSRLEGSDDGR
jgi:3-phosphoshikimate 1-carboxyvinyltransferase